MKLVGRIIREKRATLVPLLTALVVNIGVYALVVYPLKARVAGAESRAAEADASLRQADRELGRAKATLEGKNTAETELKEFYGEILPANLSAARRVMYLRMHQMAEEAGLDYIRLNREEERRSQEERQDLTRYSVSVQFEGDYAAIRRFIHALETAPEFVIIDSVALAAKTEPNAPLTLTMTLSTYYRVGEHGA